MSSDTIDRVIAGSIALLALGGAVAIAIIGEIHTGSVASPPDWLSVLLGGVGGYYLNRSGVAQGAGVVTNGTLTTVQKVAQSVRAPSRSTDPQPAPEAPPVP